MKILDDQQLQEADIVLEPAIKNVKNNDFSQVPLLIEAGYKCTLQNINLIKAKIKKSFISKIKTADRYFYHITLKNNPSQLEKEIYSDLSNKDLVSNKELLYELYKEGQCGNYDSLYIEITPSGNNNVLNVIAKENSHVKIRSI